ncbi:MAG: glycosyltransferase family 39 protein [Candidatus Solibacter usitatus]|nr:glycosyltransferase family 39 protein [Candidatus Solibacter usitatus]
MTEEEANRWKSWLGLVTVLWISAVWPEITFSLWTDEAGTWWVVKDGWRECLERANGWSAISPFYFGILWVWTRVFGLSEVAMRVPSLLFSAVSGALLFRLARRWMDQEGAWIAVVVFFLLPQVGVSMVDARPYALGVMTLLAAWLALTRCVDGGRWTDVAWLAVCAGATVWAHYMLALGLVPMAWYCRRLGWGRSVSSLAAGCVMVLPLAPQLADTAGRRRALTFAGRPSMLDLILAIVPPLILLMALLAAAAAAVSGLAGRRGRREGYRRFAARESLVPMALLAATPAVAIFILGILDGTRMFVGRYMIASVAGLAVVSGWAVRGLNHPRARIATMCLTVIAGVTLGFVRPPRHWTDWRGAVDWARAETERHPETQVVLVSAFVESMQSGAVADPRQREILFAPQERYRVPGQPLLLPMQPTAEAERTLREQFHAAAGQSGRLVVLAGPLSSGYRRWFEEKLGALGLRLEREQVMRTVHVWSFTRPGRPGMQEGYGRGR